MTVKQVVKYLEAAKAHEGEDAIPDDVFDALDALDLVYFDSCMGLSKHGITAHGRQWLKQLTKE